MEIRMGLIMGGKEAVIGTIEVHEGDRVEPGQTLLNTETGKGSRPFKSTAAGVISKICVTEGSKVRTGDLLFEYIEAAHEEASEGNGGYKSGDTGMPDPGQPADRQPSSSQMKADVVIIGAGPGGYVAAVYAAKQGLKTVLVEKDQLGGTCLNRGCIPTKALLQSAHLYESIQGAEEFGITADNVSLDMDRVFRRKDRICGENRQGIKYLLDSSHVTLISGEAKISEDKTVTVTGKEGYNVIKAGNIILATGSVPVMPSWAIPSVCMDSTRALSDPHIPGSIAIIGAGVIGMEFAFLYAACGSRVYVIEFMDHMLGETDPEAAKVIHRAAKQRGIRIDLSSKVTKILETESHEAVVFYETDGTEHVANVEKVLVAVGRAPAFDPQELSGAGIHYGRKGIETDGHLETNIKGVYAIGDVNGRIQLAHAASAQGIQVVDRILGRGPRGGGEHSPGPNSAGPNSTGSNSAGPNGPESNGPVVPSVIFTTPEIGSVGKTEAQCRKEGIRFRTGTFPFSANGKAKIQGETEGFVKLVMEEESRRLIGGVVVGPDASALIGSITAAITSLLTDRDLSGCIFAHPTTSEAVWEAAMGLSCGSIHYHE